MIAIVSDWSEVEAELDRLISQPGPKALAALEAVLSAGFAATLAAVHVDTSSLKQSAKKESEVNAATNTWTGTIRFGGPSTGVNNPVDYAIYERARGGEHDFLAPLGVLDPAYVQSIKEGLGPMTYLTLAARNMLVQVPEVRSLIAAGRIGRSTTWMDGWIFDSKPYAPPIEKYSAKSLGVVSHGGTWQIPNGHNTARFPRLFVDIWASPTRAEDGSPVQDDADRLIEDVWAAMRPYLHTLDMAVPGITGEPVALAGDRAGFPRIWGTTGQIQSRTGVVVIDSQQLGEPDLSDVRDGNGARMGRYTVGVYHL